jgi:pimeloyl-ACP methyl ester carboxylesterase/DNA-binding CsgD family transcriptional regulator
MVVAGPRTRYARSGDVSIAYQVLGTGPVEVVLVPGFVSHLDFQWESGSYRRFVERLAVGARVIRYDKRGTGLSDPVACAPTLEQRSEDLRAVLDAAGSARAALFGFSEGGPTAIRFAVDEPGRTAALILYGTSARPPPLWYRDRFRGLIARWGQGASLDMFAPSLAASAAQRESAGAFERAGASPAMARALLEALVETDVRALLPQVAVPALVMHREGDLIRLDEARYVARRIPGARFLQLGGADHLPWIGDSDAVAVAVEGFLDQAPAGITADQPPHSRGRAGHEVRDPACGGLGWQQLTSAERVVSMLAAEGLSNPAIAGRLFISRHTVEAHLKHVFVKLGIGSRVELAGIALREGRKIPELRDAE